MENKISKMWKKLIKATIDSKGFSRINAESKTTLTKIRKLKKSKSNKKYLIPEC